MTPKNTDIFTVFLYNAISGSTPVLASRLTGLTHGFSQQLTPAIRSNIINWVQSQFFFYAANILNNNTVGTNPTYIYYPAGSAGFITSMTTNMMSAGIPSSQLVIGLTANTQVSIFAFPNTVEGSIKSIVGPSQNWPVRGVALSTVQDDAASQLLSAPLAQSNSFRLFLNQPYPLHINY